ncbi:uncharacterized protein [Panulirus ornatus]|uniref:uncharacterized protein isoform X1 n=1 Tax=Panulirus ornatus TaxID=150431 RepID=UPI003A889CAE
MSVETNLPPAPSDGGGRYADDRRYSYSDFELRCASARVVRPQMTSQNGVITINPNSEIPRSVDLRRAKSLRVGGKSNESPQKRYSVIFDLPGRRDEGDVAANQSSANGRQGPRKPPRLNIPEEVEDEDARLEAQVEEESLGTGFNTVALRKSIVSSLERVCNMSGKDEAGNSSSSSAAEMAKNRRKGSAPYVQFQDEEGDWRRHSIRRMSHYEPFDYTFKVMLIGDSCVGKTCLLTKFKDGTFLCGAFISTVGIDFRNKVVTVDGSKVKLQIWDTAGQERFRSVTHAYYRDAHALLLLYDVMNKNSYDNTRAWLAEVHEYAQDDVVIMLIGNKCDVNGERVVRREDGERLAREYNVVFMETSAKTGLNVDLAFMAIARELKARKSNNPCDRKFNVADYVRQEAKTEACLCNVG